MSVRFAPRGLILLASVLALSSCIDRGQADAMLVKGCIAGVDTILDDDRKIGTIVKSEFSKSPEGNDMRHVTLTAVLKDDYPDAANRYECIFEEQFGAFNSSFTASIYQVKAGDKIIGKSGNEILGNAEDFMKLNDAIRTAMYSDKPAPAEPTQDEAP